MQRRFQRQVTPTITVMVLAGADNIQGVKLVGVGVCR
jgi:hypothetical protein